MTRPALTKVHGSARAKIAATVTANGASTRWEIERRVSTAKHKTIWKSVRAGTVAASATTNVKATYAAKPGTELTVRVVAHNSAGTTTTASKTVTL